MCPLCLSSTRETINCLPVFETEGPITISVRLCTHISSTVISSSSIRGLSMTTLLQVNLDMTDSMGPGKLVRHMENLSYTYDEYLICIGLGASISSVISKNPSYSGPSYPSSPVSSGYSHIFYSDFLEDLAVVYVPDRLVVPHLRS